MTTLPLLVSPGAHNYLSLDWATEGASATLPNGSRLERVLAPSLFRFTCVQCDALFTALIYLGPDGPALAVFPSVRGGLTTPRTPKSVAYYLDQAHRAQSVGAYSAALAMFRSALEHLLYEQGYTQRMLGPKLRQLGVAVEDGTAPKWAKELNPAFLAVLKELGDGAIHPNDGDIGTQEAADSTLVALVTQTFQHLLVKVYEEAAREQRALEALQASADKLRK